MKALFIVILFLPLFSSSQKIDSNYLKNTYDRCLDFDESKTDSLLYYGNFIQEKSVELVYPQGEILGLRLKGIYEEYRNNYDKAIGYYLQTLDLSKQQKLLAYELAANNDLAYVYTIIKQHQNAKNLYLNSIDLAIRKNSVKSLFDAYTNTGGIYNQLGKPDSALHFLKKGFDFAKSVKPEPEMSSLYNNLGNVYFGKRQYDSALIYFRKNYMHHVTENNISLLWYDCLNIADVFIEKGTFDSAYKHLQHCTDICRQLNSKSKEADTYALFSKYYERKNDYKNAYEYQKLWHQIDTGLVNSETNKTIAGLQETFNASERQKDNQLLQANIEKVSLRNKYTTWLAFVGLIASLIVGFYLVQKRMANKKLQEQNDLITRQNKKLAELNYEKNSLISVVSHDLGTPLTAIKTWNEVLLSDAGQLNIEQQKAIDRIQQSVTKGEQLIRNILMVEKAETNRQPVFLENIELVSLLRNIADDFGPAAGKKNIKIHIETFGNKCYVVSDKQFITRIAENLLSNAIKYSASNKNVWISLEQTHDNITMRFKDEGPGINKEELPHLFSKYSKLSSLPTNGEASTGLGLSIVKRLVDELNGVIFCNSEIGKGSVFTITLKK